MKDDPKDFVFWSVLRTAREQAGLTQPELEKKAGCKIAHLENGSRLPSYQTLLKLCLALNVSADYLMFAKIDKEDIQRKAMAFDRIKEIVNA